jgi:hypothetical protein
MIADDWLQQKLSSCPAVLYACKCLMYKALIGEIETRTALNSWHGSKCGANWSTAETRQTRHHLYGCWSAPLAILSRVVPIPGLQREIRAGFRDRPHQSAGFQMEHVSGATPQGLAHQQCLTAGVDADQQAMSVQPSAERLFAGDKLIQPDRLLGHLIAGR